MTGYDQLAADGLVDLSYGPTLDLSLGFPAARGDQFTIVEAPGGVTGEFRDYANGRRFSLGGTMFQIRYTPTAVTLVRATSATQLRVTAPAAAAAGEISSVTVTARDAGGGVANDFEGTVAFASTDGLAGLPEAYTFSPADRGTRTFSVTLKTAGPHVVNATDEGNGIAGSSGEVTVTPAAAVQLRVTGILTSTISRQQQAFEVAAIDPFGNVDPTYVGTIAFVSSDSAATLPAPLSFTPEDAGTRTFTLTFRTYGTHTVSAADTTNSSIGGTQSGIVVVQPVATIVGRRTGVPGQILQFILDATEETLEPGIQFQFRIDWNHDGKIDEVVSGGTGTVVTHIFAGPISTNVSVTATDPLGNVSEPVSFPIVISRVVFDADPLGLAGTALFVGGTAAADDIRFTPGAQAGSVRVRLNGVAIGTYTPHTRVVVFAQGGHDRLTAVNAPGGAFPVPLLAFGGGGRDIINVAKTGHANVLFGQAGNDILTSGHGRDILVGGAGQDKLRGGNGDDILIGAMTDLESTTSLLGQVMKEWQRTDADYATRVGHVSGTISGGENGDVVLNLTTTRDDATVDAMNGEGGKDWYFASRIGLTMDMIASLEFEESAIWFI